jgi:2,3,4,5-tetrahydropyridine-2-carboxylate N-succinyltransferase
MPICSASEFGDLTQAVLPEPSCRGPSWGRALRSCADSLTWMPGLSASVEDLWARSDELAPGDAEALHVVTEAIDLLDKGEARVAETDPLTGDVIVNLWLKHAILLLFRLLSVGTTEVGPFEYVDKIPLKSGFAQAGVRVVPGASARWGSFLDRGVVMMPSYVNIGARVGADTMVDTWATVGSCAQIGARVHLSGGVGIGGVLEPPQAAPVVVGDDVLIGSRSMITQGAKVGEGSVLGEATLLNPSIPVIDAETGEELGRGEVPPWSVVVNASRRRVYPGGEFFLPCALVVKRLDPGRRHDKSGLEAMLREHGVAT